MMHSLAALVVSFLLAAPADRIQFANTIAEALSTAKAQKRLVAVWHFTNIPRNPEVSNSFHISTRFSVRDQVGNEPEPESLLDPLHIWWMTEAKTTLTPILDREEEEPQFNWRLNRSSAGDPAPSDLGRFWVSALRRPGCDLWAALRGAP